MPRGFICPIGVEGFFRVTEVSSLVVIDLFRGGARKQPTDPFSPTAKATGHPPRSCGFGGPFGGGERGIRQTRAWFQSTSSKDTPASDNPDVPVCRGEGTPREVLELWQTFLTKMRLTLY